MEKEQKGITLIALIITIIVLLILAGVSLSATIGDNGIITQAKKAKFANKIASYDEEFQMNAVEQITDEGITNTEDVTLMNEYVKQYVPSLEDNDIGKYAIIKGQFYYIGNDNLEKEMCIKKGYNTLPIGMDIDEFISEVESNAVESILKNMVGNAFYEDKEDGSNGIVGVALANKTPGTFGSSQQWKIITEITNGNTTATYGTGWYFVESGSNVEGIGLLKNSYIIDYENRKAVKFDAKKHTIINNGSNLAVTDGLIFNADPTNMGDGSEASWGDAILYGFSGTEKDSDNNVISGWTKTAFITDGIDDMIELYVDKDLSGNGITIELYGHISPDYTLNYYKGRAEGASASMKFGVYSGGEGCFALDSRYFDKFMISGVFGQGTPVGSEYQCFNAPNDFHIIMDDQPYSGDAFVSWALNPDGNQRIFLNGEEIIKDKFCDKNYANIYNNYLRDTSFPIQLGVSYQGAGRTYRKSIIYGIRVYNRCLTSNESLANYNATVSYHNILLNNGNASTGGNTGGSDF